MVLTQNFQKEVINTKFKSENSMSNIIKKLSGEIVEDFDACPVFTELDGKKELFDKLLEKRIIIKKAPQRFFIL